MPPRVEYKKQHENMESHSVGEYIRPELPQKDFRLRHHTTEIRSD